MKHIKTITIPALKNTKTIASSNLFSYLDSDFKNWKTDVKGTPTKEMNIEVKEMTEDMTFEQMMFPDYVLSQGQILYFVKHYRDLLRTNGYATFFPFKVGSDVFVACVYVNDGGRLEVDVDRFSDDGVWCAGFRHRVVVPQLALRNSEPSPSGSLTLEARVVSLEEQMEKLRKFLVF